MKYLVAILVFAGSFYIEVEDVDQILHLFNPIGLVSADSVAGTGPGGGGTITVNGRIVMKTYPQGQYECKSFGTMCTYTI